MTVVLEAQGRRPVTARTTVVEAAAGARFAWRGRLGPPGLFAGLHEFLLTELPGGGTRLVQRESFRGLVAAVVPGSPRGAHEGFTAFNDALKAHVEHLVAGGRHVEAAGASS